MTKSLKEKTASAVFWNFMDKGGQQILQFAFLFILARILSPNESGLIALLSIFVAIANILQESGFSSALIRKNKPDQSDYTSVFYFNIAISIGIYSILFFTSPFIAQFYEQPILTNLSRFLFLSFIFNALGIIQNVHLVRKMDFKTNAKITLVSVVFSGCIAVVMANHNFGVWSLATQQVVQTGVRAILLWVVVKWTPIKSFNINKITALYHYSFKLLLNSLFNQIAGNVASLVIGKKFAINDVGNYSQAYKLGNIPQSVIASTMSGVAFPLLNNLQEDTNRKKRVFRKLVRIISFLSFPLAALTITAADSIVLVMLQSKWIGVIPMLRYLAIGSSVLPLLYLITSLLQSLGKSGLLLSMEFTRNVVTIISILILSRYGINQLILGVSIIAILTFLGEYHIAGKHIGYTLKQVLKDVLPYTLIASISFFPLLLFSYFVANHFVLLMLKSLIGTTIYLAILKILGSKVMDDCIRILKREPL
ncbi:MAG: hypothetical protein RL662_356 [Bacteroidota bacterium]|jgi:O-antigen/teichoic acid export membrane protein